MERTASLLSFSSRSSSHDSTNRNNDPLLPYAENVFEQKALRGHSFFRRCLYRRVLIWTVVSMILVSFALLKAGDGMVSSAGSGVVQPGAKPPLAQPTIIGNEDGGPILVIVDKDKELHKEKNNQKSDKAAEEKAKPSGDKNVEEDGIKDGEKKEEGKQEKAAEQGTEDQKEPAPVDAEDELSAEEDAAAQKKWDEDLKKMPWLRFLPLNGYFNGLKSLVAKADHIPEYPNPNVEAPLGEPPLSQDIPKPKLYDPYNSSDSSVKTCYLDKEEKIPAPSLYAYDGVPQYMPDPSIGSHSIFGIRDDVCFDRFGRYGPYGFGYKLVDGGSDVGVDTESSGSEAVWEKTGQINYGQIDWGDVQERCAAANKHRFAEPDPDTESLNFDEGKKGRIAVVIRLYTGFQWTQLAVLNFRAMITELSLKSGGEYNVHFLLHVKDNDTPIWSDDVTVQMLLDSNVPPEFHGLVTLWSEAQMELFYPGKFEDPISKPPINNPALRGVHGVFRSAHLPLQVFALQHPEYEHFWNWELDMRYLGNWYELFDRLGHWADQQPRKLLWERNERYYVPAHHGTWENFTAAVEQYTKDSGKPGVLGPVEFPERGQLRYEQRGGSAMPASCLANPEDPECGVGEAADLITLNPIFDVHGSAWAFSNDATGYGKTPPRRCAIITASRLSRRLLMAMHEQVWRHHHTMFTEMFPASVAFHHGFKAVYAPHPVFLDRAWEPQGSAVDKVFNGGRDHSTSAVGSPFDLRNEHNFKGATWYFNSEFAGLLWRRWLGFAQLDARGKTGHRKGGGKIRGGKAEEESEASSGRMCLRSFLVHPIKFESPDDKK
ncbi:hypothetical protein MKX07_001179 [Trichoderma sp. CBMAI-0711]|uniref:Major facilitator superfamily transporter n=1 Tax=Trichoderma parareesei TaxID=858221 RepID=A0A2H2ZNY2_TRIPA|nr:hypothetical protein MKX07_001179 [Trichoderma sp. CBMAI-0711]OTA02435.1 hypothetical protein A9Z42_0028050 [Trichoderma parareesei]